MTANLLSNYLSNKDGYLVNIATRYSQYRIYVQ